MATLAENAAAVKAAQVAIDAAIVAKGGTTAGGLANAAAAIGSINTDIEVPWGGWRNDGNTHIWIEVKAGRKMYLMNNKLTLPAYSATVDWGDGSTLEIIVNSRININHVYAEDGCYVISITSDDMTFLQSANGAEDSNSYSLFKANDYNWTPEVLFVEIGSSVLSVISAFQRCSRLRGVKIPDSVSYLGSSAFRGCYSLQRLSAHGVTDVNNRVLEKSGTLYIDLPNVERIGYAFMQDNVGIREYAAPPSLSSVSERVFDGVVSLEVADFSQTTIEDFGSRCFYNGQLTTLRLPATTKSLASNFMQHGYVTNLFVLATTPPTIQSNTFNTSSSIKNIFVPAGSVDAYKNATNWSVYASKVKPIEDGGAS